MNIISKCGILMTMLYLLGVGSAFAQGDNAADKQERAARKAKVRHTTHAIGSGINSGAHAVGHGISVGAHAVTNTAGKGVHAIGHGIHSIKVKHQQHEANEGETK